ncbi:MAG: T9SS type A sorting domain-containing protein [Bacteroidetes bacterium]|nr:T9SS type A sorting domain-containing protein [Bacteroidota bacterium]
MSTKANWTTVLAFFAAGSIQAQKGFSTPEIQRNLKTARMHVFNPADVKETWIEQAGVEMPEPAAGSSSMRRKVDAERSAYNQRNVKKRGNLTGNPTPAASLNGVIEGGWDGSQGGGTPNDNHVAVGNDGKFISVMNTVIRAYDASGKQIKGWSLENFINLPNKQVKPIPQLNRVFDPRVLYDPFTDRYIVLFMEGTTDKTSKIIVGFSSSSNPLDPWNVYAIPGKPTKDSIWSDYPIVAHNRTDLFFTVNLIGVGASWEEGFTEAIIWQINKQDGYNGDTLHKNFYSNIKYKGKSLRSICAIQNGPMPDGTDNYFISVRPIDKINDTVFLLRVTNTQRSGNANLELQQLKSPMKYGFPPSALQPDTSYKLRTNDCRVLTALRLGNTIQYLQNSINFGTYQAHLTHNTIYNISSSPRIEARMITDDSLDMGYPAICAAGKSANDPSTIIAMVYSSPWHYPGTAVLYHNRYGEYSDIVKVKTGQSLIYYTYIPKGEQRWGDYEGIQPKYNEPGVFYMVGSYGKQQSMFAWVARIKVNDKVLNQPVEDVRVFPNPALQQQDMLIEIKLTQPGRYLVYLTDMAGNRVRDEQPFDLEAGTNLFRLHANDVANGVYQLVLRNPEGQKALSQKVVFE